MSQNDIKPRHLTVKAFAETIGKASGWPSEATIRHLIFHAADNGFDAVMRRVGRRVLLDIDAWQAWIARGGKAEQPSGKSRR